MIGELSSILISVLSTSVVGTLIGTLLYWRYNRKLKALEVDKAKIETENEKWHLYKVQLEEANKRNIELLKINREKETHYQEIVSGMENRFKDQTLYLRDVQHSFKLALEENNRLTTDKGKLQRKIDYLEQWKCRRPWKECKRREPEQKVKPDHYVPFDEDPPAVYLIGDEMIEDCSKKNE